MSFTDSLTLIKSSAQSAISNAFWIFSPSAFIICAEGEKIQRALEIADSTDDLINVNKSVKDTIVNIIKMQMLLQFKLEEASKINGNNSKRQVVQNEVDKE